MPDVSEILSLQSVALTRDKQIMVEEEVNNYHDATNFVIREILKRRLSSTARTIESLQDEIARKYLHLRGSVGPLSQLKDNQLRAEFARRFSISTIQSRVRIDRDPSETDEMFNIRQRRDFGIIYETQYIRDVVKTARVEIGKHSRLAQTLRSIRERKPYFKPGRIIYSKPIIQLSDDAKAVLLLTGKGDEVPLVFDKRTRNESIDILQALLEKKMKYERVRIISNREGYLDIVFRIQ